MAFKLYVALIFRSSEGRVVWKVYVIYSPWDILLTARGRPFRGAGYLNRPGAGYLNRGVP